MNRCFCLWWRGPLVAALGALLVIACSPVQTANPARTAVVAANDYRVGVGDRLKVIVFGEEDLSGEFSVDARGNLSLPLIQSTPVAGLTTREVERAIGNRLQPEFLKNPRVSVEVINYRPIYVLGEVRAPGSFPYVSGMTVINAIALAGGYTYRAKKSGVRIVRANDTLGKKVRAREATRLNPGDVVEVPERFF
jgi:polysaccharide export outer membrane protein